MKPLVAIVTVVLLASCSSKEVPTIDPSAKALLKSMAEAAAAGSTDEQPDPLDAWRSGMQGAIPLAGDPEPVASVEDRTIPGKIGSIVLRTYRAMDATDGAVLYFHGGGFVGGDLDTIDTPLRRLANQSGRVVISVDYRLAPEFPYDDAMAALEYVAQHFDEFKISADRITVMGDSAGGSIAAALAIRSRIESGPAIERQVLVYPNTDLTPDWSTRWPSVHENDGKLLSADMLEVFYANYVGSADPYSPTVSPVHADDLQGLPPALVVTAGHDLLRDEGRTYVERLTGSGVATEHWHYPGQIHGFFQLGAAIPEGHQLIDRLSGEIR
jgi:acetyl esterase